MRGSFPDLPSTDKITQAVRSPISFLDSLADTHAAENEAAGPVPSAGRPPDPTGDGVLASGGTNRPSGVVRADEAASIPGVSISDPQGTVHSVRGDGRDGARRPVPEFDDGGPPDTPLRRSLGMALSLKRRTDRPEPDAMTLTEHLTELRRRVVISVAAFFVAGTAAFLAVPVDPVASSSTRTARSPRPTAAST